MKKARKLQIALYVCINILFAWQLYDTEGQAWETLTQLLCFPHSLPRTVGSEKAVFLTKPNVSISSAHSASSASTKRNKKRHLISRMQYQNSDKGQTFEKGPRGLEPFFRNVAVEPFLARPRKLTPLSERLVLALPDSGIGERDRVELGSTASCKANVYQCRCALLKCLSRNDCLHSDSVRMAFGFEC